MQPSEFDDEFEDDDPLPAIGHCKAIYPFDGKVHSMHSHSLTTGHGLYFMEKTGKMI